MHQAYCKIFEFLFYSQSKEKIIVNSSHLMSKCDTLSTKAFSKISSTYNLPFEGR